MDLVEGIYSRRAVRSFTDEPVKQAAVMQLLLAAVQAPSAINQQPWAFAVIRGRERLAAYSERAKRHLFASLPGDLALHRRSDQLASADYNVFHHAGTLIVILSKPAPFPANEDCCLAAENLLLAAHGMGLGACPIGFVRSWLDLPEIKRELGFPTAYTPVAPIVVGHPAGETPRVPRIEPEVVVWLETDEEATPGVAGRSPPPAIGPWDRLVGLADRPPPA